MIVYHAGIVKIEEFYIPYGGLHFGGIHSALECAMRKLYEGRRHLNDLTIDTIHIHRCELLSTNFYESNDKGSDYDWKKLNDQLLQDNVDFDIIKYINEHEIDVLPSYCTFKKGLVKILDHSTMHMDWAEDVLYGRLDYDNEYYYNYSYL